MASLKISKVVLKSLFKKSATLMYPVIPREWTSNTRGHIGIEIDKCIACGICMRKCPTNAITVDREKRTWSIERMQCVQCGHCVRECPKSCLTMEPLYTEPNTEKVVDTFELPAKEEASAAKGEAGTGASGKVKCNTEECVYCGLCVKTCPVEAITVDRAEKKWEVSDACVGCGACVDKCPKKCLSL